MHLDAGCELIFAVTETTPMVLMLRPRSGSSQWVAQETYEFQPHVFAVEYTDGYGNLCQRLVAAPGSFHIWTRALVETADTIDVAPNVPLTPIQGVPDTFLQFLLPSRYCQSDDPYLGDMAQQIVDGATPGYDQVAAICRWIHSHITYRYGSSDTSTSALNTLEQKAGVCRDFVHLGMSLCRCLNIPARMVVGYLYGLEPMDQHAWFEAFVDGRWFVFDATQETARGGRIALAYGRDAADVAMVTHFGSAQLQDMHVWVEAVARSSSYERPDSLTKGSFDAL
ncbi:MAG: transglutaminase family protein [Chloroflexaceae bacterium]|nr:transglutaminase family protein [Chloroflexaceae bacterium]